MQKEQRNWRQSLAFWSNHGAGPLTRRLVLGRRVTEMLGQECEEALDVAAIGAEGVTGAAFLVSEPVEPATRRRNRVGGARGYSDRSSHARMTCSITWARNDSRSVPWPG